MIGKSKLDILTILGSIRYPEPDNRSWLFGNVGVRSNDTFWGACIWCQLLIFCCWNWCCSRDCVTELQAPVVLSVLVLHCYPWCHQRPDRLAIGEGVYCMWLNYIIMVLAPSRVLVHAWFCATESVHCLIYKCTVSAVGPHVYVCSNMSCSWVVIYSDHYRSWWSYASWGTYGITSTTTWHSRFHLFQGFCYKSGYFWFGFCSISDFSLRCTTWKIAQPRWWLNYTASMLILLYGIDSLQFIYTWDGKFCIRISLLHFSPQDVLGEPAFQNTGHSTSIGFTITFLQSGSGASLCRYRDNLHLQKQLMQVMAPAQLGKRRSSSKNSNTSSMGKYSKCKHLCGHFLLLPLTFIVYYALLIPPFQECVRDMYVMQTIGHPREGFYLSQISLNAGYSI